LLSAGANADVFAVDEDVVLRRYRTARDTSDEVTLLRHVVENGFPAPAVVRADGTDLIMERLHGPTLLQALAAGEVTLPDAAATLVDLHARLHAIPAPPGWADRPGGGPVVVHLGLHPANVILSEVHGPAVVDWADARTGTAALDVALTALVLAEVAVDAGGVYSQAARALLVAFLAASDVNPQPALAEAVAVRSRQGSLVPGERELVPAAAELVLQILDLASPAA